MAQTSVVEWLVEQMNGKSLNNVTIDIPKEIIEQANEMHKEQMHKCASFWRGKENDIEKPIFIEWYNENFNQ
jgi:hypothetical protein